MAHTELHEDGSRLTKFAHGPEGPLSKWFGKQAERAFADGATEVQQKIIQGNEACPCGSGIRFDMCCAPESEQLAI